MKKRVFLILLLTFALMFGILTSASASGVLVFGSSGDASRLDPGDVTD